MLDIFPVYPKSCLGHTQRKYLVLSGYCMRLIYHWRQEESVIVSRMSYDIPSNLSYKTHLFPNINVSCFILQLPLQNLLKPVFSQEWRCSRIGWDWICLTMTHVLQDILAVLDVVGETPTGDAPTTSEWSTILMPTKVCLISEVWGWYWQWEIPACAKWKLWKKIIKH